MPVALINPFVVPTDKEEEFLRAWNETTRVFSSTPGFIETHLHKNASVGVGRFQYINIAFWESADAWNSSRGSYKPEEESIPGVEHYPGIFQEVIAAKSLREVNWRMSL
ncbi:MAG: antibiotic biosynthesis monooxygenase [Chroococcidiopsidaceae cyanobacterium CP_BM_RX_35]|nr:antibiotic biosynthesis monooxygenase [Chroococcidiopsidaceae cyanobacterium CP_BM_RX_35]